MILWSLIFSFALLVVFTVVGLLIYSGLFYTPEVETSDDCPLGKCSIAYKYITGSYNSNLVGACFTEAISIAPSARGVGVFYDNPDLVPEEKLRSAIGCVIEDDSKKFKLDPNITSMFKEKGFHFWSFPLVQNAVVSSFPYTTPFSVWLSSGKVYPRLSDYISSRNLCAYPMIELYSEDRISYMAPLSKQEAFFVPEAVEDGDEMKSDAESTASTGSSGSDVSRRSESADITSPELQESPCLIDECSAESHLRHRLTGRNEPIIAKGEHGLTDGKNEGFDENKENFDSSEGSSFEEITAEEKLTL